MRMSLQRLSMMSLLLACLLYKKDKKSALDALSCAAFCIAVQIETLIQNRANIVDNTGCTIILERPFTSRIGQYEKTIFGVGVAH